MAFLVQEKREFMLGGKNFEKMIFKAFEIKGEELENFLPKLTTKGNPFSLFEIFNLEQRK